jgi:anti-sigma factor RsiW
MDNREIRSVLSAYRAGEECDEQPRFVEARRELQANPELAEWWKEEQELDRLIGLKLESVPVPAGLKARLLDTEKPSTPIQATWPRRIALLAASIVLLAVFFSSWQGLFQPATTLADYRDEMVSFVRLDPTLDLKTSQFSEVSAFLKQRAAPSELALPSRLQQLNPVGCRTLRFRGRDVALVCFRGEDGGLIHLLVIDRKALGKNGENGKPQFAQEGEWMTAAWMDDAHAYLLVAKSSRETLAKYLGTS